MMVGLFIVPKFKEETNHETTTHKTHLCYIGSLDHLIVTNAAYDYSMKAENDM